MGQSQCGFYRRRYGIRISGLCKAGMSGFETLVLAVHLKDWTWSNFPSIRAKTPLSFVRSQTCAMESGLPAGMRGATEVLSRGTAGLPTGTHGCAQPFADSYPVVFDRNMDHQHEIDRDEVIPHQRGHIHEIRRHDGTVFRRGSALTKRLH